MGEFLNERLPINVRMGASYSDEYAVEITQTANGSEYRRLVHPYPRRVFNVFYTDVTADIWDDILSLYHRAFGMYAGFRVKAIDDYTTNGRTGTPTALDQELLQLTAATWQLQVAYGTDGTPLGIGRPVRSVLKPVSGTTLIAIDDVTMPLTTMYSVDATTGVITFVNKIGTVTGITQASSAVITVGAHTFSAGEFVYISGVVGMTEINGQRAEILSTGATDITVDIDSTLYTAYSSGGTVNTAPQSGETVTGGCEFDIPCRFNSRIDVKSLARAVRETSEIEIIELLNL